MSRLFLSIWSLLMGLTVTWILLPDGQQGEGQSLALLKNSKGRVEVRRAGSFSWSSSRKGTNFYALDSIATGSSSTATLVLNDGTELQLPEDTQLKIQPQTLDQGLEISVLRGGVVVQKVAEAKTRGKKKSKPLIIGSGAYSIDLSNLKGAFSLSADAMIETSEPSGVIIKGQTGSVSLEDVQAAATPGSTLGASENLMNTSIKPIEVKVAEVAPKPLPPPPLPPPPKPAPKPLPPPPPPPPPPPKLALAPVPEDKLEHLIWQKTKLDFWSAKTFTSVESESVLLPATWSMEGRARWDTPIKIENLESKESLILRKPLGPDGLSLSLEEVAPLLGKGKIKSDVLLSIQAGLVKKSEDLSKAVWAPKKMSLGFHTLQGRRPLTLVLDDWKPEAGEGPWFMGQASRSPRVILHILEPALLLRLEPWLRGASGFQLGPLRDLAEQPLGLVLGPKLVGAAPELPSELLLALGKDLKLDLIFKGKLKAYLGGRGGFDLLEHLEKETDTYYIRRGLSLKLDSQLFKTQAAARDFMSRFNPYFFTEPVEIKYSSSP